MHLTPREKDKLLISMAAMVARRSLYEKRYGKRG
ncbi:MAG TPA: urease subunit gamma, partial [Acetobacteraceae bacterium]|nr:urease subunit gamma [Acetobacteraceae bacterium]